MDWENHLDEKRNPHDWKYSKKQSEITACEQKTTTKKTKF